MPLAKTTDVHSVAVGNTLIFFQRFTKDSSKRCNKFLKKQEEKIFIKIFLSMFAFFLFFIYNK